MCGVVGVFAPGRDAARLAYFALYALQHRGQESAGIAVSDGGKMLSHNSMGLVGAIFDEGILAKLTGYLAVGHTRYSTSGGSIVVNAQPLLEQSTIGEFVFAHNGNLTNDDELRSQLSPELTLVATSDSEVFAKSIVDGDKASMVDRIADVMSRADGAYSCVSVPSASSSVFAMLGEFVRFASANSRKAATLSLRKRARWLRSARFLCARSSRARSYTSMQTVDCIHT